MKGVGAPPPSPGGGGNGPLSAVVFCFGRGSSGTGPFARSAHVNTRVPDL